MMTTDTPSAAYLAGLGSAGSAFGELKVAEVGQRRPAPQAQALLEEPGGRRRVAASQRITPGENELLELQDVQLISRGPQLITGGPGSQPIRFPYRPKRPAQLCEADPQVGHSPLLVQARPQLARQPVSGDHPVGVNEQHRQHSAGPGAAHRERSPAAGDLQGTKDLELHGAPLVPGEPSPRAAAAATTRQPLPRS